MKHLKKLAFFTTTVVIITLQSCGTSGNNASTSDHGLDIIRDHKRYSADVQTDSLKKMVSLTNYLQPLLTDWRYATTNNFTKEVLYNNPEAFLRLPAAKALQAVQEELELQNLSLLIYDAYRPYSVTKKMWEIIPDERYAASPSRGSGHNRGIAVDVSLIDLKTGKELQMPTGYDDFSEKAHHDFMHLDAVILANRSLLRSVMEKHGFRALETEWWHYYLPETQRYPLMDFDFEELRQITKQD